jgi:hypothetical protein
VADVNFAAACSKMENLIMSNLTTKLVTPTRLRQLVDCYGSSSFSWPEDERQSALSLLKGSPELNTYRDQTRSLDKLLEKIQAQENHTMDQHAVQSLQQRIMSQLPEQESPASNDNTLYNLSTNNISTNNISTNTSDPSHSGHAHRSHGSSVWIGSIAASLFIISLSAGVIHQLFSPGQEPASQHFANQQASNLASNDIGNGLTDDLNNDFTQWAWEDITGESLVADTDSEPTTLLAMVELELPAEY